MRRNSCLFALLAVLSQVLVFARSTVYHEKIFVSRPDIQPPIWEVKIHNKDLITPGYWFVSPYEENGNKEPGGPWIGPHIFDGYGNLVWSGTSLFDHINVMDFKVQNINGTDMLSMLYAVEGNAVIIDNNYRFADTITIGETGLTFNMHDFHTVEDGTHYLYLTRNLTHASEEISAEIGFKGKCRLTFPGFQERDIKTGKILFSWTAEGIIPLADSSLVGTPVNERCRIHWDYLHSNSIDKFPDGNYLLSARHSDTLYKISKDDGSIIWRLNGRGSDGGNFEMGNLNFSRQHHARVMSQNNTHTLLSIFDNAQGADPQKPLMPFSRGLQVALRTDVQPMTAEMIANYDHPHRDYAFRRGSYQILPNGGAFIGWSERALHSEHTADGKLIMEAQLQTKNLGTYRAFKQPWIGEPMDPPDLHSQAYNFQDHDSSTSTIVYVSWNGATEVARWDLYKTDLPGGRNLLVGSVPRAGFETSITYEGFAMYVFVNAIDKYGRVIGRTRVLKTIPPNANTPAVQEELEWLREAESWTVQAQSILYDPTATFATGLVSGFVIFLVIMIVKRRGLSWRRQRKGWLYSRVQSGDAEEYDETSLDDIPLRGLHSKRNEDADFKLDDDDENDESDDTGMNGRTPFTRQLSGA